jgi:hypothetical protein
MRLPPFVALILAACGSSSISTNSIDAPTGGGPDVPLPITADAPPGTIVDGPPGFQLNDAGQPLCQSKTGGLVVCQCADGLDNDGDGFIDGADPECTGPFDNDESSYATGIPGDNQDPFVQDCFFDGDSGGGNDGCRWDIRCVAPPNGAHCNNNQLDGCATCKQLTPNGCDCFGCCTVYVPSDGGLVAHDVRIIDTCTAEVIDDPLKCPTCTKVVDCQNTCDPCEYCLGRPPDPSCTPDAGPQCPTGVDPCPPDGNCGVGFSCITGCCLKYIP